MVAIFAKACFTQIIFVACLKIKHRRIMKNHADIAL